MATSKVTVHFSCPVQQVWHTVTDLAHTAWRSDLAQVEVLDEVHFVEHTKSGYTTNFVVTACEPIRFWAFTMENRWWMHPFVPGYLKRQQKLYLDDLRRELLRQTSL